MRENLRRYWLVVALLTPAGVAAAQSTEGGPPADFSQRLGQHRVVSGRSGPGDLPDMRFEVSWRREDRRANLARQRADESTGGETILLRDLVHRQIRQVLTLGAEVGLLHDLSLFVQAPVVLADDRWLQFADGVDAGSATILRDGILPGAGASRWGLNAEQDGGFEADSRDVFRGPTRRGLEYLAVGLSYAIMNQRRDSTRPTWVVRFEPRLALGKEMAFDPAAPDANRSVNPGFHQFVISTFFARRPAPALPVVRVGGFYAVPKAATDSAYGRFPLGSKGFGAPQHRAGAEAGLEYEVFTRPAAGHRLTLDLTGMAELRFFGLARSELWEPLSGSSACGTPGGSCRPHVDVDLDGDGQPQPYPGIVRSPGYGRFGGELGVALELSRTVRLSTSFGFFTEQDRSLTDGRSGVESFDRPGRLFRVDDARAWHLGFQATAGLD